MDKSNRGKLEKVFPSPDNIDGELKSKLENAARYIIETSARETSSGNYITYIGDVPDDIISPTLFSKHINDIADIMQEYEAVLDIIVEPEGAIDVVMGLAYCPNFEPHPEEADEYPDGREILDPLKSRFTPETENPQSSDKKSSLMDKVEVGKQKAAQHAKPAKEKTKKQEVLE